jgi:hypothetical protein
MIQSGKPLVDHVVILHSSADASCRYNLPLLAPHLDFARIWALRKHLVVALKQLVCPQSIIHGWSGLVMSPVMYALLEPNACTVIIDLGPFAVYANFATEAAILMANKIFKTNKN